MGKAEQLSALHLSRLMWVADQHTAIAIIFLKMKSLFHSPERISVLGFFLLITAGTVLLMLPWASTGDHLSFIDALFTSTSASCVTGLAVVDTGGDLSLFGQGVLLFLIQTGGLGIMTISTLFLLSIGRRPGLTSRIIIEDTFTNSGQTPLSSLLKEIILIITDLGE